jgi:hypothetical protein
VSLEIDISSDTSNFLGQKFKARFVDYKVSFISTPGLAVFELPIQVTRTIQWIEELFIIPCGTGGGLPSPRAPNAPRGGGGGPRGAEGAAG